MKDHCSTFSQPTFLVESPNTREGSAFDTSRRLVRWPARPLRTVRAADTVQSLSASTLNPLTNRPSCDAEPCRNTRNGRPVSHHCNHFSTIRLGRFSTTFHSLTCPPHDTLYVKLNQHLATVADTQGGNGCLHLAPERTRHATMRILVRLADKVHTGERMEPSVLFPDRRRFLHGVAFGAATFTTPGAFAETLMRTPPQTEGPFYPDRLPLDTDNDLLILNDAITSAVGEITHLTGRILTESGKPVRNAVVEIWQCDANGVYLHSQGGDKTKTDGNFQGFGRFLTGRKGEYYFRTIKPVPYPPRTPHIHFAINKGNRRMLTTQCYINGHPQNNRDLVMRQTPDPEERRLLMVDFHRASGPPIGEFAANFDIVIGRTPEDHGSDR